MPPARVLVVGAGATGACTALRLRQLMGREVSIDVWEKARGPGGRMSTNRQELNGANVRADMGAQYLSLDGADKRCAEVADMLVKAAVCTDVPASVLSETPERRRGSSWRHLAGTEGGVNDALKKILDEAGATLHMERRVASIDAQSGCWRARPFDGAPGQFDAVVLAVPGCGKGGDNLNKIHGSWESCLSQDQNWELQRAQHDDRWSYAFFLPLSCTAKCDAFFGSAVEKVVQDDVVHLMCYQSRKTAKLSGEAPAGALAVVVHTTIDWAKRNSRAGGRDQRLLNEVAERTGRLLGLDSSLARQMLASKTITWKQSQITKAIPSSGPPCMLVEGPAPLILAGDYFTESCFGGCLQSGFAAAEAVAQELKGGTSRPKATLTAAADVADGGGKGKGKG